MQRSEWLELARLHLETARQARTFLRDLVNPDYWDSEMRNARKCIRRAFFSK